MWKTNEEEKETPNPSPQECKLMPNIGKVAAHTRLLQISFFKGFFFHLKTESQTAGLLRALFHLHKSVTFEYVHLPYMA